MKTDLAYLNDLIVEVAVCQIAVSEHDPSEGQFALDQARRELDRLKIQLINTIEENGLLFRLMIGAEAGARGEGVDISNIARTERKRVLYGK